MFPLKDAKLVPQQHNFEVFLVLRATCHGDNVEHQREETTKDEEHHGARIAQNVPTQSSSKRNVDSAG